MTCNGKNIMDPPISDDSKILDPLTLNKGNIMDPMTKNEGSLLDEYLDINDLTFNEKLERAVSLKERGAIRFKDALFKDAHRDYRQAFKFVVSAASPPEVGGAAATAKASDEAVDIAKIIDLKCALYLNIAACLQKNNKDSRNEERIITCCSKVLALDSSNVKAFYRRAKARADLGEWEEAKKDLKMGLESEPENKALKTELAKTIKKEKDYNSVMAKRMANMFLS